MRSPHCVAAVVTIVIAVVAGCAADDDGGSAGVQSKSEATEVASDEYVRPPSIAQIAGAPPTPTFDEATQYGLWWNELSMRGRDVETRHIYQFADYVNRARDAIDYVTLTVDAPAVGMENDLFDPTDHRATAAAFMIPAYRKAAATKSFALYVHPSNGNRPMFARLGEKRQQLKTIKTVVLLDLAFAWSTEDAEQRATKLMDAWRHAISFSNQMATTRALFSQGLGLRALRATHRGIGRALDDGLLSDEQLGQLQQELAGVTLPYDNARDVVRGRWAIALEFVQWLYPDGELDEARLPVAQALGVRLDGFPTAREAVTKIEKSYAAMLLRMTGPTNAATCRELRRSLEKPERRVLGPLTSDPYDLVGGVTLRYLQAHNTLNATRVELAVEAYRRRHGALPEALDELELSAAVLVAPGVGKPFVYRREGDSFELLSVAADGSVPGGEIPHWTDVIDIDGAARFWPPKPRSAHVFGKMFEDG